MPVCRKVKRNKHYREKYMRTVPPVGGKCRCVYCGRWVPANKIEVDHVIPVQRCAESLFVRMFLCASRDVNSIKNLRYACSACNAKKGASLNILWQYRAVTGTSNVYWALRNVLRTGIRIAIIIFPIYISIPCAR